MKKEEPGKFPYTRGLYKNMYNSRLWTMRQYAGFTSAEESNERFKYLLENGVMGLSVAFDLPTQMGYDSDHDMAEGEVGKVGVPISTLNNMETLFKGIPLDKVSTSMTINSTAGILLAYYIVNAENKGISFAKLKGTIQNDVLKEPLIRSESLDASCEALKQILLSLFVIFVSDHLLHRKHEICSVLQRLIFLAN